MLKTCRGQICNNLVFVQYFFTGEVHSIQRAKHGNAKHTTHTYCRTKPSVLAKAKYSLTRGASKSAAGNTRDNGGVENEISPTVLFRAKQLHQMKHSSKSKEVLHSNEDEFSSILDMA